MTDIFDPVVGQPHIVAALRAAADEARAATATDGSSAMTHSWLITGPAGSGRSTAALAFAAALVGDGPESFAEIREGRHVDVEHVVPEAVEYSLEEARALIDRAYLVPMRGPWQVLIVEDADRLSAACANALLKTLEEPPPAVVWVLCAPSADDVLPTIRSRCRVLTLHTLSIDEVVATLVERDGIDPLAAQFAARVAQGHVGRARALATDEQARERRRTILALPRRLMSLASCLDSASDLVATVNNDVEGWCAPIEAEESDALLASMGKGATGKGIGRLDRRAGRATKDLQARHKRRRRRIQRDLLDRAVTDLISYYRDVLVRQLGAGVGVINTDVEADINALAAQGSPEQTLRRIDALTATRGLLESNVAPLAAFESMTLSLADPYGGRVQI